MTDTADELVGELRDLSFNLEPVVLRDHGFAAALDALGESRAREHGIDLTFDIAAVVTPSQREAMTPGEKSNWSRWPHRTDGSPSFRSSSVNCCASLGWRQITAVKAFARWAWKDGRTRAYELGNVGRRNEQADRRYVRRPW